MSSLKIANGQQRARTSKILPWSEICLFDRKASCFAPIDAIPVPPILAAYGQLASRELQWVTLGGTHHERKLEATRLSSFMTLEFLWLYDS